MTLRPDAFRADPVGVFFLYLRSFKGDAETGERWAVGVAGPPKVALSYLLEPAGPLQEVGGKALGLGQSRPTDDAWREAAIPRIIHATAIFVSPGTTRSLEEELDLILRSNKITRRTFLLMEPAHRTMLSASKYSERKAAEERRQRWGISKLLFEERGVDIPDYRSQGAIISLYYTHRALSFVGLSRHQLFRFMQEFNVDLTKYGSYDIGPEEECPCNSGKNFKACHGL